MAGKNLLWHTRYDKATGAKSMVRECRTCANDRIRTNRRAKQRNVEIEREALLAAAASGGRDHDSLYPFMQV